LPGEIFELLESTSRWYGKLDCPYLGLHKLSLMNGSIEEIVVNLDEIPIQSFHWELNLKIRLLSFFSEASVTPLSIATNLPELRGLYCNNSLVSTLHFSGAPFLREIYCADNQLESLDLKNLTELEVLDCSNTSTETRESVDVIFGKKACRQVFNQLKILDLQSVPNLRILKCCGNQIRELNLRYLPKLEVLECSSNQLKSLDVSFAPRLKVLNCKNNYLAKLDLSGAPGLTVESVMADKSTEIIWG